MISEIYLNISTILCRKIKVLIVITSVFRSTGCKNLSGVLKNMHELLPLI